MSWIRYTTGPLYDRSVVRQVRYTTGPLHDSARPAMEECLNALKAIAKEDGS